MNISNSLPSSINVVDGTGCTMNAYIFEITVQSAAIFAIPGATMPSILSGGGPTGHCTSISSEGGRTGFSSSSLIAPIVKISVVGNTLLLYDMDLLVPATSLLLLIASDFCHVLMANANNINQVWFVFIH